MKVGYKTILPVTGDLVKWYEATSFRPCCSAAVEAYEGEALVFAGDSGERTSPTLQIVHTEKDWDGDLDRTAFPVSFCPFCGAGIECVEEKRVRKVVKSKEEVVRKVSQWTEEVPL